MIRLRIRQTTNRRLDNAATGIGENIGIVFLHSINLHKQTAKLAYNVLHKY